MYRILVVDDEANLRKVLGAQMRRAGYRVSLAEDGESARASLDSEELAAIVTDLRMPRCDGLQLLSHVAATQPATPVIVLTAHGTIETAVEAMRQGAFDFLTKPIDGKELKRVVARAVRVYERGRGEPTAAPTGAAELGLLGDSQAMQRVLEVVAKVAPTPLPVLISGETGTGKELVARAIHQRSPRVGAPFIKVNSAAIPETLIESELFGHEEGAFTGATRKRPGRFELAHGGTLFLDEVGETSAEMQAKLLRVLQEGTSSESVEPRL